MVGGVKDLSRLFHLGGMLHVDVVDSAALRVNPLGDPAARPLAVYTPPGYDPNGSRRYPVLYALNGYTGDVASLLATRPWESSVVQWADRLIAAGTMPPAIVAVVDGFTRLGGSQYVDSIHNGAYATYIVRDVVAHVDAQYRTIAAEGGRAVFGKSSGGFGALHLVLGYPGTFAAFASHSGDAYFRYAHYPYLAAAQRAFVASGPREAFVAAFETATKRPQACATTMEVLGYAAALAAARARSPSTCRSTARPARLRDDVFARWLAYDPVERIAARNRRWSACGCGFSIAAARRIRARYRRAYHRRAHPCAGPHRAPRRVR